MGREDGQDENRNIPLDAVAERLLGVAIVVVGPDGEGVDVDGPGSSQVTRELRLQALLVALPLVADVLAQGKGELLSRRKAAHGGRFGRDGGCVVVKCK